MQLVSIFVNVILPLAIMAAAGFIVARRFRIDVGTLAKLAIYLFIPAIVFDSLSKSKINGDYLLIAAGFTAANTFIMSGVGLVTGRLARAPRSLRNAVTIALAFYNSANFGIPVMSMAFGADAVAIQTAVVATQSTLMYSWGVFLAAGGRFRPREAAFETLKLPVLYALILGLIVRYGHLELPGPIETAVGHLARAMIPLALVTLGTQIARSRRAGEGALVTGTTLLRLIGGPIIGLGLVTMLRLEGLPAQVLLVGSGAPTAVNTTILAIEYDNEPDFAVNTVSMCTILSGVTVAGLIFLAKSYM
jgi:predicted permease